MKIRNYIFFKSALLLLTALAFVGCTVDDEEYNHATLLGKWYYTISEVNGIATTFEDSGCDRSYIMFTEENFQDTIHSFDPTHGCQTASRIMSYVKSGLMITLDADVEPYYEILSLTERQLRLLIVQSADIDDDGEPDSILYTFSRD